METQNAQKIERQRRQAGGGDGSDIDMADIVFRFLVCVLDPETAVVADMRLQLAVAGQRGIFLAHEIEAASQQDRGQTAEHDRWQHLGENLALSRAGECRIANRQGDGAFADAASHDRRHHIEERVMGAEAQRRAHHGADNRRQDRTDRQRHEDFEKAADQHVPIHGENAADDDRSDEEIKKIRRCGEIDDRLLHLRWNEMIISQG